MYLYDSRTQSLARFQPQGDRVTIYVCGITPYDTTHLGHAFTYTANDILIRYLESQGHIVVYAQNVTDIDDDILRKARETGDDWRALGNRWTAHFIRDMQALNVRPPDFYPGATSVIPEIIAMVKDLLAAGVAYERSGNVFFNVDAWPQYGQLSHLSKDEMLPVANERGNRPDDPHKRHPLDFVLWQAQAPGEPAWDSPWGPGRPGWHIECSTMSTHFLGETIDIHSGGGDLIFPHHESEIAQVEPVTQRSPFVRHWLHVAMVGYQGEKMSKSLGNLVMVRDLLKTWSADALRLYLGRHHYRAAWSYEAGDLASASQLAEKLRGAVEASSSIDQPILDPEPMRRAFRMAMEADLNTPEALQVLNYSSDEIRTASLMGRDVAAAQLWLRRAAGIFGLRLDAGDPEPRVQAGWEKHLKQLQAK